MYMSTRYVIHAPLVMNVIIADYITTYVQPNAS